MRSDILKLTLPELVTKLRRCDETSVHFVLYDVWLIAHSATLHVFYCILYFSGAHLLIACTMLLDLKLITTLLFHFLPSVPNWTAFGPDILLLLCLAL